jgi:molybdenum-dependent DNA-binding transcriptional regulator ModE
MKTTPGLYAPVILNRRNDRQRSQSMNLNHEETALVENYRKLNSRNKKAVTKYNDYLLNNRNDREPSEDDFQNGFYNFLSKIGYI